MITAGSERFDAGFQFTLGWWFVWWGPVAAEVSWPYWGLDLHCGGCCRFSVQVGPFQFRVHR